jgi:hypothetical protein
MKMFAGFVKFMVATVQTWSQNHKVMGYTVCSIERRQDHRANLRFIHRRVFQVETDGPSAGDAPR